MQAVRGSTRPRNPARRPNSARESRAAPFRPRIRRPIRNPGFLSREPVPVGMLALGAGGIPPADWCPVSGQVPSSLASSNAVHPPRDWTKKSACSRRLPSRNQALIHLDRRHLRSPEDGRWRNGREARCGGQNERGDDWHPTTSTNPKRGSPCPSGRWNAPAGTRALPRPPGRRAAPNHPRRRAPMLPRRHAPMHPRRRALIRLGRRAPMRLGRRAPMHLGRRAPMHLVHLAPSRDRPDGRNLERPNERNPDRPSERIPDRSNGPSLRRPNERSPERSSERTRRRTLIPERKVRIERWSLPARTAPRSTAGRTGAEASVEVAVAADAGAGEGTEAEGELRADRRPETAPAIRSRLWP